MRDKWLSIAPIVVLLATLAGCASDTPTRVPPEPIPPLSEHAWREIKEEIWTASTLAQSEAGFYARQAMQDWMERVKQLTEKEFVPWYSGYWTQQWIGFKAGWYEMNKGDGDEPVDRYLAQYLLERFTDLVLEPADEPTGPREITEQAAALYVRLMSKQLRCIPRVHAAAPQSLQERLRRIPLIALPYDPPVSAALSVVFDRDDLEGMPAYETLLAGAPVDGSDRGTSADEERLQAVAGDSVARLLAGLPVRAGGSAAAAVAGQALGLFITIGVSTWSAISHERQKPDIESRLRDALAAGLEDMWQQLMEDPLLGVLFPVNHMTAQIETGLFPVQGPDALAPF